MKSFSRRWTSEFQQFCSKLLRLLINVLKGSLLNESVASRKRSFVGESAVDKNCRQKLSTKNYLQKGEEDFFRRHQCAQSVKFCGIIWKLEVTFFKLMHQNSTKSGKRNQSSI
jgi:hypothetical protein